MRDYQDSNQNKRGISDLAHISTLSEDELDEINGSSEEEYEGDDEVLEGEEAEDASEEITGMEYVPVKKEKKKLEHTEPTFEIVAKPDPATMYEFIMYHSYKNVIGIISILLGVFSLGMLIYSLCTQAPLIQTVLFAIVTFMFASNSPFTLKSRAKKQSELVCDEKNTITYTLSDAGFDLSRGDDEYAPYDWDHMFKVVEGKLGYFMYLEKNRAFVVPKVDIPISEEAFRDLLKKNMDEKRIFFAKEK